jgi:hypothetical protein
MNGYQKYIIFSSIKEFILALSEVYDDEPLHEFKTILTTLTMDNNENIEQIISTFLKYYEDGSDGTVTYDDIKVDIRQYLNKGDEYKVTIEKHIKSIKHNIDIVQSNTTTSEETFLNNFIKKFLNDKNIKDIKEQKGETKDIILNCAEKFKPDIEQSVEEFRTKNLDLDRLVKLFCIKIKDFLSTNTEVTNKNFDRAKLIEIIDLGIKYNLEELVDHQHEIIALLSSSGMLAHLPIGNLMFSMPSL